MLQKEVLRLHWHVPWILLFVLPGVVLSEDGARPLVQTRFHLFPLKRVIPWLLLEAQDLLGHLSRAVNKIFWWILGQPLESHLSDLLHPQLSILDMIGIFIWDVDIIVFLEFLDVFPSLSLLFQSESLLMREIEGEAEKEQWKDYDSNEKAIRFLKWISTIEHYRFENHYFGRYIFIVGPFSSVVQLRLFSLYLISRMGENLAKKA